MDRQKYRDLANSIKPIVPKSAVREFVNVFIEGDVFDQLTKSEKKRAAMIYRHKSELKKLETNRISELNKIAQLIGEGVAPVRIREEIIRMIK